MLTFLSMNCTAHSRWPPASLHIALAVKLDELVLQSIRLNLQGMSCLCEGGWYSLCTWESL